MVRIVTRLPPSGWTIFLDLQAGEMVTKHLPKSVWRQCPFSRRLLGVVHRDLLGHLARLGGVEEERDAHDLPGPSELLPPPRPVVGRAR